MQLSANQVKRFYGIWFPLLRYVNSRCKVTRGNAKLKEPLNPSDASAIRDALWADDQLLEMFVRENPANLSQEDLAVARSWRHRVAGTFVVVKHLTKHSVFLPGESGKPFNAKAYGVVGLSDPLADMMPDLPCMVKAVLVPFEGRITYDSLFIAYPITFGRNIRGTFNQEYQDMRKFGTIVESLDQPELALLGAPTR